MSEPPEPIRFREHRWIELGSPEMDQELANAHNELHQRITALEQRMERLEQRTGEQMEQYTAEDWVCPECGTVCGRDPEGNYPCMNPEKVPQAELDAARERVWRKKAIR